MWERDLKTGWVIRDLDLVPWHITRKSSLEGRGQLWLLPEQLPPLQQKFLYVLSFFEVSRSFGFVVTLTASSVQVSQFPCVSAPSHRLGFFFLSFKWERGLWAILFDEWVIGGYISKEDRRRADWRMRMIVLKCRNKGVEIARLWILDGSQEENRLISMPRKERGRQRWGRCCHESAIFMGWPPSIWFLGGWMMIIYW